MEDIAPTLLEKLQRSFQSEMNRNQNLSRLYNLVGVGTASYQEAQEFAIEVGKILAKVFEGNISSGILPDGRLYYNIANRIIPPMLENNYNLTAEFAVDVQNIANQTAGITMAAVKPELNQDKVAGIVNIVSGKEKYDEISYMLIDPIINFTQCVVDDTVKANADLQYKAGLSPKIVRTSTGKCCAWCDKLAGVYDYEKVRDTGNNVYRRHKNCRCLVELVADKQTQNVHTKRWAEEDDVKRRIQNSMEYSTTKYTKEQATDLQKRLTDQIRK